MSADCRDAATERITLSPQNEFETAIFGMQLPFYIKETALAKHLNMSHVDIEAARARIRRTRKNGQERELNAWADNSGRKDGGQWLWQLNGPHEVYRPGLLQHSHPRPLPFTPNDQFELTEYLTVEEVQPVWQRALAAPVHASYSPEFTELMERVEARFPEFFGLDGLDRRRQRLVLMVDRLRELILWDLLPKPRPTLPLRDIGSGMTDTDSDNDDDSDDDDDMMGGRTKSAGGGGAELSYGLQRTELSTFSHAATLSRACPTCLSTDAVPAIVHCKAAMDGRSVVTDEIRAASILMHENIIAETRQMPVLSGIATLLGHELADLPSRS